MIFKKIIIEFQNFCFHALKEFEMFLAKPSSAFSDALAKNWAIQKQKNATSNYRYIQIWNNHKKNLRSEMMIWNKYFQMWKTIKTIFDWKLDLKNPYFESLKHLIGILTFHPVQIWSYKVKNVILSHPQRIYLVRVCNDASHARVRIAVGFVYGTFRLRGEDETIAPFLNEL